MVKIIEDDLYDEIWDKIYKDFKGKNMKVSFLVTYYNQEKYVEQSLNSILAIEKPFDWEILIGDDGSTDGTIDIIKRYIESQGDKTEEQI